MPALFPRTKILATIGPASASVSLLRAMMRSGLAAVRLNFSHGSHRDHAKLLQSIRLAARLERRTIPVLQDLMGPRLRLGFWQGPDRLLSVGQTVRIGEGKGITIPFDTHLLRKLRFGHRLRIGDQGIELRIMERQSSGLVAEVMSPGMIRSRQGIHLPDTSLSLPPLTEKDLTDLAWGLEHGVDAVALSFVSSPEAMRQLHRAIRRLAKKEQMLPLVFAKIETPDGVRRAKAIVKEADGLLIARGDLGLESDLTSVPLVQKDLIRLCHAQGKISIVATQMLESMTHARLPTRAEVSDVANAAIDGTDLVMLSGETAIGKYPVQTVSTMSRILSQTEESSYDNTPSFSVHLRQKEKALALHLRELLASERFDAVALSAKKEFSWIPTLPGWRLEVPVYLFVSSKEQAGRFSFLWGMRPVIVSSFPKTQQAAEHLLLRRGWMKKRQKILFLDASV